MNRNADWDRFVDAMRKLHRHFPERPRDAELLEDYFAAFAPVGLDAFEAVVAKALLECKFFPKIAELRESILGKPIPAPSLEDEAEIACGRTWKAIGDVGGYASPCFDDPAIHLAVIGHSCWADFARSSDSSSKRTGFTRLYLANRRRIARDGLAHHKPPLYLPGQIGQEPSIHTGFLGDPRKILAWHLEASGQPSPFLATLEAKALRLEAKDKPKIEGPK